MGNEVTQPTFEFELGASIKLVLSGEVGLVIGRAELINNETLYQCRYKAGDGRQVEDWLKASAIEAHQPE